MKQFNEHWDGIVRGNRANLSEAAAAPKHSVKVGDIFYSSWGYEQTEVTFHLVTKVTGASVVTIELESVEKSNPAQMTGTVTPHPSKKTADGAVPRRSLVNSSPYGVYIKVREVTGGGQVTQPLIARLWDGKPKHVSHYG